MFGKVASPLLYLKTFVNDSADVVDTKMATHTSLHFKKCIDKLPKHGYVEFLNLN